MQTLKDSKAIPVESSDSSDAGLPPAIPVSKPKGFSLGLSLGGLGLSTVARDGERTAEQMADMSTLHQSKVAQANKNKESSSDSDSDAGLPPPLPTTKPKRLSLGLSLGGLGLSTVAKDGEKTAE